MNDALAEYERRFIRLNVHTSDGQRSPHKVCMLLAVLDLAQSGALAQNRIAYGPGLIERFNTYFAAVAKHGAYPTAHYPFFHLSRPLRGGGGSFWHLHPVVGKESEFARLDSARSVRALSCVEFASLDKDLYALLADDANIDALRAVLANHWFQLGWEDLAEKAAEERKISEYERELRRMAGSAPGTPSTHGPLPDEPVRSAAFRRVVLDAYDFTCAATGERVVVDGAAMVQAAHIRPFADTGDNDPCNGMALTPDMHWAMDQHLIAPGPDLRWHVHARLEQPSHRFERILSVRGRPVRAPKERYLPRRDVLEWRLERLRR